MKQAKSLSDAELLSITNSIAIRAYPIRNRASGLKKERLEIFSAGEMLGTRTKRLSTPFGLAILFPALQGAV